MTNLALIVLANLLFLASEVARHARNQTRARNFEDVRTVASYCTHAGWVTMRLSWHGPLRTIAHLDLWHPTRREHRTLQNAADGGSTPTRKPTEAT